MNPTTLHRGNADLTLAGFIAAGVVAAILAFGGYWLSRQQFQAGAWVAHTQEVLASIANLRADAAEDFAGPKVERGLRALRALVADNPAEIAAVEALGQALAESPPSPANVARLLRDLDATEHRLLDARLAVQRERARMTSLGIAALSLVLVASLVVLYRQVRRRRAEQQRLFEAEQRFHVMTRDIADYAILMLDREGRVLTWNTGAQRIKGYGESEIVGRDFACFYLPEDVAAGKPRRVLALAAADGHYEEEGWRLRKDGTRFWANVTVTPLRDVEGGITGFAKVTRDLTERRRAAEAQRAQELSRGLINAQEEERRRIARELHDETGQALTAIRLRLVEMLRVRDASARQVEECIAVLDQAVKHIRGMAVRLRPPMLDDLGLVDALEWALEQQTRAAGWQSTFEARELADRLPSEMETACFRIAQEALTNAARHARARKVNVRLHVDDHLVEVSVTDDGTGFEPGRYATPEERRQHFGLVSMSERASLAGGQLEVVSAPGKGTTVRASFPRHAGSAPETRRAGFADRAIA